MRLSVLGACGAWPQAGEACSGFLVEHAGFRLLLDLGYATLPRLLQRITAEQVDAVFVSHGHPDHCADLNPLLRARALGDRPSPPLPVYAPAGALDAVLALDRPGMLDDAYVVRDVIPGAPFELGPFRAETRLLPHWLPNAGIRLTVAGRALAYTGDAGPSRHVVDLARDADLLLAEATYPDHVPDHSRRYLSSARTAGRQAAEAGADRLLLTHLWPGTGQQATLAAAAEAYGGTVAVAVSNLTVDLT
ncbi:MBL fold metallo-hydrolase [Actinoplanes sp. NPDC026623]|uniref:MBL fold metallo-hydrolase n=1 Tax=Actinoplanes sp. NPDC026623 TaxID=3155610 RepID=UPI00341053F5